MLGRKITLSHFILTLSLKQTFFFNFSDTLSQTTICFKVSFSLHFSCYQVPVQVQQSRKTSQVTTNTVSPFSADIWVYLGCVCVCVSQYYPLQVILGGGLSLCPSRHGVISYVCASDCGYVLDAVRTYTHICNSVSAGRRLNVSVKVHGISLCWRIRLPSSSRKRRLTNAFALSLSSAAFCYFKFWKQPVQQ